MIIIVTTLQRSNAGEDALASSINSRLVEGAEYLTRERQGQRYHAGAWERYIIQVFLCVLRGTNF